MAEAPQSNEFDLHVLSQLEKQFEEGEFETLVARSKGPGYTGPFDPSVLVKHLPSGKEAICKEYHSQ